MRMSLRPGCMITQPTDCAFVFQGSQGSCSSPRVVTESGCGGRIQKASTLALYRTNVRLVHQSTFSSCRLYSSGLCRLQGSFKYKSGFRRLQSSQLVTAGNDQPGSDGIRSSAQAADTHAEGREDEGERLVNFWPRLQEGLWNLKSQGLLRAATEAYQKTSNQVHGISPGGVIDKAVQSKVLQHAVEVWHGSKPWFKWPFVIFFPFFLVVTIVAGLPVSVDLIPLWIIGPFSIGFIIKSAIQLGSSFESLIINSRPYQRTFAEVSTQLYEDAKAGQLLGKLKNAASNKSVKLQQLLQMKRLELVMYVKSGNAFKDITTFVLRLLVRLYDWAVERYEDFIDWVRPFWRAVSRLMKKLF